MALPNRYAVVPLPAMFAMLIGRVLGNEGGYVNNPRDSGGETNWGISKRSYPGIDIKNLTREEAMLVYFYDFWAPIHGAQLHQGVAYQLLDIAVNAGVAAAVKMLQRAAGVTDDGNIGPATLAAVEHASDTDTIMRIMAERLEAWTHCHNWADAGAGWVRRAAADLRFAAEDT